MAVVTTTIPHVVSHRHHPVKAESGTDTMKLVTPPQDVQDARNRMSHNTNKDADTLAATSDLCAPVDALRVGRKKP